MQNVISLITSRRYYSTLLSPIFVALFISNSHCSLADNYMDAGSLPEVVQLYIELNFPNHKIVKAKKENGFKRVKYEVMLDSYIELDFDEKGEIIEIESNRGVEIPARALPPFVSAYLEVYMPERRIVEWEKKWNWHKVELDNDLELYFDLKGNFLKKKY
ncbi:PepSY-like domain-containing protein [Aureibacter tunicatorum]|uniref:Uncharacterized protein YuzE n=1 Tax=Aureibacter tunicatorum TaxID=866807 RepID=A0AAE4BT70_9BACT|nr:PepSY-like domain-containing protein [Aureibacter tunicatorum]MDR6239548.1 uncharacterized protein YuzE [Aureibacter tunicatorum]BDD04025.1 hypothetical protein AUTU_15080 [Aureibacter tunicatorum]